MSLKCGGYGHWVYINTLGVLFLYGYHDACLISDGSGRWKWVGCCVLVVRGGVATEVDTVP